jgi:predicted exporter
MLNGMIMVSIAIYIFIFISVLLLSKNITSSLIVSGLLLLFTAITLIIFERLHIRLSLYTIVLFPLFLGISVDDFIHILFHQLKNKEKLKSNSRLIQSITLTTITTVAGYGSLLIAANTGFRTMGLAAVIGLLVAFSCACYLLPILLTITIKKEYYYE